MTINKACEIFYNYGNVGRSPEDLLAEPPTTAQLQEAFIVASMAMARDLAEAHAVIRKHFGLSEVDDCQETLTKK